MTQRAAVLRIVGAATAAYVVAIVLLSAGGVSRERVFVGVGAALLVIAAIALQIALSRAPTRTC
jgi:hypothetical protein